MSGMSSASGGCAPASPDANAPSGALAGGATPMPRRDPSRPPSCEDSLRALGRYLDFTGLAEISLVVRAGEWALTARRGHDARQYPVQVSFTVPEILALRNVTASQRGRGKLNRKRRPSRLGALQERGRSAAPLSAWLEQEHALSYQELLRAI